jgi:hypothetical protein
MRQPVITLTLAERALKERLSQSSAIREPCSILHTHTTRLAIMFMTRSSS